jgi:predicted phage terminase large subunit-like protein
LLVEIPVRHGKSELISHWTPLWFLSLFPDQHVIITTYETSFAQSWGAKVRNDIIEHGHRLDRLTLRADAKSAGEFKVRGGGGLLAVGRGGAITGRGANLLIGDDLLKNFEEANSPTVRENTWQWWDSTAMTRLEPGASAILLMSRWHEDDPPGRIKAAMKDGGEEWDVVTLPAIAEAEDDALERAIGEALWPERWPLHVLEKVKLARGPLTWNALYQQHPQPLEGGLLKYAYMRYYSTDHEARAFQLRLPEGQMKHVGFDDGIRFGTMDLAISTKTSADFTVTAAFQWSAPHLILLDLVRDRMEFPEQVELARAMIDRWDLEYLAVEDAGYQAAFSQASQRRGLRVRPIKAKTDKVTRAVPLEAMMAAGNVFFPTQAAWLTDLIDEMVHFPTGMHDDQVDALAYAAAATYRQSMPKVMAL